MDDKHELMTVEKLRGMVYDIRGKQVMLDFDLANLYGYDVKAFNQQVKRNIARFPEDFMFELTKDEMEDLSRSQFVTSIQTVGVKGGRTHKIKVFTEQGIYMLATVLRGELAEKQSIAIMRAFKTLKDYMVQAQGFVTKNEFGILASQVLETKDRVDGLANSFEMLNNNLITEENLKEWTILKNQKFEANVAYIHIYKQAKECIYIIDDYPSIKTLELLVHKQEGIKVVLFTDNKAKMNEKLQALEVNNFNTEYPSLVVKPNGETHDRYIILDYGTDSEQIYLCGASSKDAGSKVCTIVQLNDRPIFYSTITSMLEKDDLIL